MCVYLSQVLCMHRACSSVWLTSRLEPVVDAKLVAAEHLDEACQGLGIVFEDVYRGHSDSLVWMNYMSSSKPPDRLTTKQYSLTREKRGSKSVLHLGLLCGHTRDFRMTLG